MLISHEVPLPLLEQSFRFNDYDYCLPIFWEHEQYRNHYIEARKRGRFIILDNGLFEGKLESKETLLEIAEIIQPDVIISPDAWNDANATWNYYKEWKKIINPSKLMVVLQANNKSEVEYLHNSLVDSGVKYIGFNHLGAFYDDYAKHSNPSLRKTLGRINFTHSITLSNDVHYHLLGTNLAEEFKYQLDLPQIKSLDTSNPVVLAFEGEDYEGDIVSKPKTKMESIMNYKFDEFELNKFSAKALRNIQYFRNNYAIN